MHDEHQESVRERGPASFEERVCPRRYRVGGVAYMLPMQPAGALPRDAPIVGPLKPPENCNPQARLHPRGPSMPKRAAVPAYAKHSRFSTCSGSLIKWACLLYTHYL